MKKLLFSALLAIIVATSSFASGTNVNVSVLNSFKSEFRNAADVTWISKTDFAKATFTIDGVKMEAFYNIQGELIGTSKEINLESLPVNAKRAFAKKYDGYTVTEVISFENADGSAYYFSAENDTNSIIFKVDRNDHLTTFKKTNK